ncbi:MAG: DUF2975 domain-containing protein [Solirubrobacterales bacterium]|nr:DUF2975 domain-containing protein [Solirubrobacterales bacterium]
MALAIGVLWWLSIAATIAAAAVLVVLATHRASGGALKLDFYFQLPPSAYHISSSQLGASAAKAGLSSGQLSFARPRLSFVLVAAGILALAAAWWLFVLHQLRALLAALQAGDTFARQNALRLRRIGFAVIAFELAHSLAIWAGGLYLEHTVVARGVNLRSHFGVDMLVLVVGLLLLALAAAFRVGSELADEQALTV